MKQANTTLANQPKTSASPGVRKSKPLPRHREDEFAACVQRGIEQIDAGQSFTTEEILDRASHRYLGKAYKSQTT